MKLSNLWKWTIDESLGTRGPCPLPNAGYEFWRGDLDLIDPVENSTDREFRSFLTDFASAAGRSRSDIRARVRQERFVDLHWHALRAAVFAIRSSSVAWLRSGLTALAAIDWARAGVWRLAPDLSVLYHAGMVAIRGEVDQEFRRAASIGGRDTDRVIGEFLALAPEDKHSRFAQYQAKVRTETGIGFALRYNGVYDPSYDMTGMLVRVRQVVTSDRYQPYTVVVGTGLAEIAVRKYSSGRDRVPLVERGTALIDAIQCVRAGIGVVGLLRPGFHAGNERCGLTVDVFECRSEQAADFLLDRIRGNAEQDIQIGLRCGDLLGVIRALRLSAGVDPYEDVNTLRRFEEPVRAILNTAKS